ncbi:DUF2398 family protein [Aestuariimicrobium sp. Y1814]|uniref:DUF2398 family protein n=1 Tax=Aestuariimicrobium sp. Y1814 TaxID=3418742 RepID=UPI003DA79A0C
MSEPMLRADLADKQRAMVGLLAKQLVAPWTNPELYALVHRHAHLLATWSARLGYRLARIDQCYRLRRMPIDGTVSVPIGSPPSRSELLLVLYAAACLDDHREESITLQDLSDLVHLSTVGLGRWPYDPNLRTHRRELVRAIGRLITYGVLEQRTEDQFLEGWERRGEGIGAGYVLHRDALTLLIDTGDVALALNHATSEDDTRGVRLLRQLIETQAILFGELTESEQNYLMNQRSRLTSLAEEMTGGQVEFRSDAMLLILPPDRDLPAPIQIDFPSATAADWVSLRLLDDVARVTAGTHRRCPHDIVLTLATEVHRENSANLTKELRDSPTAVLATAQERLSDLGLLRILPDGAWELTPSAGRFRDAELRPPDIPAEALFPEET